MRGVCALCSVLIATPEDRVLDIGRSERELRAFLLGVASHVQRCHPEVPSTLNLLFLELQLLFYSFFLEKYEDHSNVPWLAGQKELHQKFRDLLNKEQPIEVKKVRPAISSDGGLLAER